MAITSQSFYFYADELISSDWLDWSETAFSSVPNQSHHNKRALQSYLASSNSSVRTRAGFCYNLGLLKGPVIQSRTGTRGSLPLGWKLLTEEEGVMVEVLV
jgi:hypothetical protein